MRAIIILAVLLSGCALGPKRIATIDDRALCNWYGDWREEWTRKHEMPAIRAEIERRNLVSPDEWDLIDRKKVRIGMSICALRASWGTATENRTSTRYGSSIQHVYRCNWCRHYTRGQYVYTENGVVTAIQD
jgi:uncharacterized protein YceK